MHFETFYYLFLNTLWHLLSAKTKAALFRAGKLGIAIILVAPLTEGAPPTVGFQNVFEYISLDLWDRGWGESSLQVPCV